MVRTAVSSTAPGPLATPGAWNLVCGGYVTDVVPQFEPFAWDALDAAGVGADARIVDVACGPGTLSCLAAARGADVDSLDFAEEMVASLVARAAREGLARIRPIVGDGMALPYEDRRFDHAFSMFGLMFFPDRSKGFAELRRVLVPGGGAFVSSWVPFDRVPAMSELLRSVREALPTMPFGQGPSPLGDEDCFRDEFVSSGFTAVDVRELRHTTSYGSPADFWSSMKRSMASIVLLQKRLGAEAFRPVDEAVRASLESRFGAGRLDVELVALLGSGFR